MPLPCATSAADLEAKVSRLRLREQLANARGIGEANSEVTVPKKRLWEDFVPTIVEIVALWIRCRQQERGRNCPGVRGGRFQVAVQLRQWTQQFSVVVNLVS